MKHTHNSWDAREGGTYSIKTDLENLATRLEQAGPERQAELLGEAYEAIFGFSPEHDEWYGIEPEQRAQGRYFTAMLDCGAYLSAVEMLVPAGLYWTAQTDRDGGFALAYWCRDARGIFYENCKHGRAKTLSLALAAACVRAILKGGER